MKKNLFKSFGALAIATIAITSCNAAPETGKLHITSSELKGLTEQALMATMGQQKPDTIKTPGGKLDVTIDVAEPTTLYILPLQNGQPVAQVAITAVGGEELVITGDLSSNYYFSGSAFYQEYDKMDRALEPVNEEMNKLIAEVRGMQAKGVAQDSLMAYYQSKAEPLQQRIEQAQMDYIKANPKSEAAATLIAQMPAEKTHAALDLLDASVKQGRMKSVITPAVERADKELARQAQAKNVAEGKPAPDFTLNDINGKPLSLSSLRGKYVLLDFWGSWCVWCIKGFPEMKKYYEKYKGKFEILGIDCNDTEQKWKDAVKKEALPWLHVYNPRGGDITTKYAIEGYPTKILVDPEGNIAKVIVGEDPAFYTYMDEKFGK